MVSGTSDSIPLFRFRGIQVYLHWIWFLWAFIEIYNGQGAYSSIVWNIAEYLALFLIVLLHEFGHALACRQTGGKADRIVLWPLGGIAFVQPPPRAGAELWSIAAGPLVNVVLFPLLMASVYLADATRLTAHSDDFGKFLVEMWRINRSLLIFNLLPLYPLDGGQILRSLLWFKLGRARSLQVASMVGLVGIPLLALYVLTQTQYRGNLIFVLFMAYFLWQSSLAGWRHAGALLSLERAPKYAGFSCPSCQAQPPVGSLWLCPACGHRFDPFATDGSCPHCRTKREIVPCPNCGEENPLPRWDNRPRGRPDDAPVIEV